MLVSMAKVVKATGSITMWVTHPLAYGASCATAMILAHAQVI